MQTGDDEGRRLPRDTREARAVSLTAGRMAAEARGKIGPVAGMRELLARCDLRGLWRCLSRRPPSYNNIARA